MKRFLCIFLLFGIIGRPMFASATFDADLALELEKAVRALCERIYKYHADNGDNPGFNKTDCAAEGMGGVMEKIQSSFRPKSDQTAEIKDSAAKYCGQGREAYACTADGIPPSATTAYRNMVNYSGRENWQSSLRLRDATAVCLEMAELCKNWNGDSEGEFEKLSRKFMEIQSRKY